MSDACKTTYEEIKKDKKHRYVVFYIRDEKQIDVEFVGKMTLFFFICRTTLPFIVLFLFLIFYFRRSKRSLRSVLRRFAERWHGWMPLWSFRLWIHPSVSRNLWGKALVKFTPQVKLKEIQICYFSLHYINWIFRHLRNRNCFLCPGAQILLK